MQENSPINSHKVFKSTSLQLTAAILTEITDATFSGFDNDQLDKGKKIFLISYPKSTEYEFNKVVGEFDNKILSVNLFYYNRNLNFLRDRLFTKKTER